MILGDPASAAAAAERRNGLTVDETLFLRRPPSGSVSIVSAKILPQPAPHDPAN
jgi:hypothetical protein